jgi:hypothetical protein
MIVVHVGIHSEYVDVITSEYLTNRPFSGTRDHDGGDQACLPVCTNSNQNPMDADTCLKAFRYT